MFWIFCFWLKSDLYLSMEFEVNAVQWVGICLMVVGLILNTVIFIFSYYKIVAVIREQQKKDDSEHEQKHFPLIRFIFRFRKVLKEVTEGEKEADFELIIAFLKWTLLIAVVMIVFGLLLFLTGFLF